MLSTYPMGRSVGTPLLLRAVAVATKQAIKMRDFIVESFRLR